MPCAVAKPCANCRGGRGASEGRYRALVQCTQCLGCKGWEKGRQFLPAARCHGDGRARAAAAMNTHELGEPGGCTHCALNAKARRVPAAQRAVAAHGAGAVRRQRPHVVPGARWSTTPWDVGLGAGAGWIGAGSRSLGNGGSQFPPIDVAVRAGGARGLHKHPSGTARPVPRRAAGRCETMARLTGTRPTAARRWGCAATAFLLLLLTVQAGKGGGGGGEAWRGPWVPRPSVPWR